MTHRKAPAPLRAAPPALAVALLGIVLAGCPRGEEVARAEEGWLLHGRQEARDTTVRHVRLGDRTLAIDIPHGSVTLRGTEAAEASLTFERIGRGDSRGAAERRLATIEIHETGDDEHYAFTIVPDADRATEVRLTADLPAGVDVVVRLERGAVRLEALHGSADVRTRSGGIEGSALRTARLHAHNDRGHHLLEFAQVPPRADIRLRSANGHIEVVLPEQASLQLAAETRIGDIGVTNLSLTRERFDARGPATRYRARLGGGAGRLVAETEVGNIRFRGAGAPPAQAVE